MANAPQSMYEDLAPFAGMVVDQSKGVTVGDLVFASAQDFWSTGFIPLSTFTLPANSEVQLFSKNIGESGQGSGTAVLTAAETNNVNGDRMPANQVYIGLKCGFQIYQVAANTLDPFPLVGPVGMLKVTHNTVWSLNIGDGIKRFIGSVAHYPAGCGVSVDAYTFNTVGLGAAALQGYRGTDGVAFCNNGIPSAAELRTLPLPVIFPPNIKTDIRLLTGGASVLTADDVTSGNSIAYRMTFRGYMMTLPV